VTQGRQILYREISSVSQCGIETGSCVTLGQNESVAFLHIGFFGSMFISSKYKNVKISAADKDPPGCPAFALMNCGHNALADIIGTLLQF